MEKSEFLEKISKMTRKEIYDLMNSGSKRKKKIFPAIRIKNIKKNEENKEANKQS